MEDKDDLKEILGDIDQVNEPIDLEEIILNNIQKEEQSKAQIAYYKAQGIKALIMSGILIMVLATFFSLPSSIGSFEYSIITYTSITITLFVLFIQLEMGKSKIFNNLKNNVS
ncbi:hypothetical protein ACFQZJ_13155 [Maribacter chungangensis]|uniref:Uncharacterized protein n=1 Tax=Maribacter chungangensis TaxID=1069117 RepID=A0ABW3B5Z4_9FLAO